MGSKIFRDDFKGRVVSGTAIFFVASPLQALFAIEACVHFCISRPDVCIVKVGNVEEKENIQKILSQYQWGRIYYWSKVTFSRKSLEKVIEVLRAYWLKLKLEPYDHVFVGDFVFTTGAIIGCGSYTILGDGNKLLYQRELFDNTREVIGFPLTRSKSFNIWIERLLPRSAKDFLSSVLGLPVQQGVAFFSPFDLKEMDVQHEFKWCRARVNQATLEAKDKTVYFLGTYFSESVWGVLTSEEYYLWAIGRIVEHYRASGLDLVYIPSRHESDVKIQKIESAFGVGILRPGKIVELEFLERGIFPAHVASFYSTALINLPMIYSGCKVEAFKVDLSQFLTEWFEGCVTPIYDYYRVRMPVIEGVIDHFEPPHEL